MPHTQSRYQMDLGFTDGRLMAGPGDIVFSGTTALTRNAAGDWSINQGVGQTVQYAVNVNTVLMRRTGFFEDLQEQFGGSVVPGSAQPQNYRPDVIGAMAAAQQLQPRTAFKIKGYKLNSFDVIYQANAADLTSINVRVDQDAVVDNVAIGPTAVLANGANGLIVTNRANRRVINVALPANQQIYRNLADTSLWIELAAVTPGGGTFRLYGIDLLMEFNFN
jgi:hypothetical protein